MASDLPRLGRLEAVPPRQVWAHEALGLTPWLLANADVLSSALGMDLDLEAAEHPVGGFSLDLIGRDRASGERVIIENQLETSDHTHLGQILTYAGGTDPATIVWVAPSFRDEHRSALEWLNQRTNAQTRFFAVQLQVVRIGDSDPAPLLSLVVQPNDWGKTVRSTTTAKGHRWGREELRAAVAASAGSTAAALVDRLIDSHLGLGPAASLYWGEGQRPSVTAVLEAGGLRLQPWSVYFPSVADDSPLAWSLNLDWIHKSGAGVTDEETAEATALLAALPDVAPRCAEARSAGWKRRPSFRAATVLSAPNAVDLITAATVRLLDRMEGHTEGR